MLRRTIFDIKDKSKELEDLYNPSSPIPPIQQAFIYFDFGASSHNGISNTMAKDIDIFKSPSTQNMMDIWHQSQYLHKNNQQTLSVLQNNQSQFTHNIYATLSQYISSPHNTFKGAADHLIQQIFTIFNHLKLRDHHDVIARSRNPWIDEEVEEILISFENSEKEYIDLQQIRQCFIDNNVDIMYFEHQTRKNFINLLKNKCNINISVAGCMKLWKYFIEYVDGTGSVQRRLNQFVNAWNGDLMNEQINLQQIQQCFIRNGINYLYFKNGKRRDFMALLKRECGIKLGISTKLWFYFVRGMGSNIDEEEEVKIPFSEERIDELDILRDQQVLRAKDQFVIYQQKIKTQAFEKKVADLMEENYAQKRVIEKQRDKMQCVERDNLELKQMASHDTERLKDSEMEIESNERLISSFEAVLSAQAVDQEGDDDDDVGNDLEYGECLSVPSEWEMDQDEDEDKEAKLDGLFVSKLEETVNSWTAGGDKCVIDMNVIKTCFIENNVNYAYFEHHTKKDLIKLLRTYRIKAAVATKIWNAFICPTTDLHENEIKISSKHNDPIQCELYEYVEKQQLKYMEKLYLEKIQLLEQKLIKINEENEDLKYVIQNMIETDDTDNDESQYIGDENIWYQQQIKYLYQALFILDLLYHYHLYTMNAVNLYLFQMKNNEFA